jgi:hypothetical protein
MDPTDMNACISGLSELLRTAAAQAPDAQIEHCPDWTSADLVQHLGDVQWFWAEVLTRRATTPADVLAIRLEREDRHAQLTAGWTADQSNRLVAALDGVDDDVVVWTWWPSAQHVGFIRRRQTIEALIHTWDACNAADLDLAASVPFDGDTVSRIASLGLVEFAEVMSLDLRDGMHPEYSLELHPTDVPIRTVLFADAPGEPIPGLMGRSPSGSTPIPPFTTRSLPVTGTALDLLLTLWGRRPPGDDRVRAALATVDLT